MRKSNLQHFCNTCKHLNITEEEQQIRGNDIGHRCNKYRKRVIHNCIGEQHYKIFPCLECMEDKQKAYEDRHY